MHHTGIIDDAFLGIIPTNTVGKHIRHANMQVECRVMPLKTYESKDFKQPPQLGERPERVLNGDQPCQRLHFGPPASRPER